MENLFTDSFHWAYFFQGMVLIFEQQIYFKGLRKLVASRHFPERRDVPNAVKAQSLTPSLRSESLKGLLSLRLCGPVCLAPIRCRSKPVRHVSCKKTDIFTRSKHFYLFDVMVKAALNCTKSKQYFICIFSHLLFQVLEPGFWTWAL